MKEFTIGKLRIMVKPHNISLFSDESEIPITPELVHLMADAGSIAWKALYYHDVTGFGNDYSEYYDKEFDNEGTLSIGRSKLVFERPYGSKDKLYQFNKAKFQTFMYDLKKMEADK